MKAKETVHNDVWRWGRPWAIMVCMMLILVYVYIIDISKAQCTRRWSSGFVTSSAIHSCRRCPSGAQSMSMVAPPSNAADFEPKWQPIRRPQVTTCMNVVAAMGAIVCSSSSSTSSSSESKCKWGGLTNQTDVLGQNTTPKRDSAINRTQHADRDSAINTMQDKERVSAINRG